MIVIGIDPHKSTHTATALDSATNTDLGSIRIDASITEYKRLIVWAKPWPDRRWAIENADGLGHHLALWLLAIGEVVLDIPTTATARVRELSRGGRRKNDRSERRSSARRRQAGLSGDRQRCACFARRAASRSVVQPNSHRQPTPRPIARADGRRCADIVDTQECCCRDPGISGQNCTGQDSTRTGQGAHHGLRTVRSATRHQQTQNYCVARRARHTPARYRRSRPSPCCPHTRPQRPSQPIPDRRRVCQLHRHCTRPDRERRRLTPPIVAFRRPATELRHLHDRHDPDPDAAKHRTSVLRHENRRSKSTPISYPRA